MKQIIKQPLLLFFLLNLVSVSAQKTWSLKACVDSAFKNNLVVNQNRLTSRINKINYFQSKGARLPNLNLTDGQNFNSGYSLDPYTYQYTTQNISINNLSLNSSVTLFNGYLLVNTVRQNKLTYDASVLDIEKSKNDLKLNIIGAYLQVLMDYEAIEVVNEQLKSTIIQLEQTRILVQYGKLAELNLLQVQSQLASDKLTKVNAENQLQLDKITLQQFIETPARADFDIYKQPIDSIIPTTPISTQQLDYISEGFLPQIKSAKLRTDAALYSLKMARSGWFPKLTMTGLLKTGYSSLRSNLTQNTSYNSQTIGYVNDIVSQPVIGVVPITTINRQNQVLSDQLKNNFSQAVGFSITVPIFNNLLVKSNVDIASVNILQAKLNEQQTKNDLRKSIEIACTNQASAGKNLLATEEQMNFEKKTYSDMEKKYSFGALDATSFLIEKNNYNKVSISLIQAKYDYVLKAKIVDFYLGKPLL